MGSRREVSRDYRRNRGPWDRSRSPLGLRADELQQLHAEYASLQRICDRADSDTLRELEEFLRRNSGPQVTVIDLFDD